jgi:calcineurin-like phosphoesterase family protein
LTTSNKKFNFVYKTTNLINGKFYFGVHSTDNLDDGYLGSGRLIRLAIEKYGKENFKRDIVKFHSDIKDAYLHEKAIVTQKLVDLKKCYNIALGGTGGNTIAGFSEYEKMKLASKKSKKGINKGPKNGMYGKTLLEAYGELTYNQFKVNCSNAKLGLKNGMYGIPPWESPSSDEGSRDIWSNADKYYDFWTLNKHVGHTKLATSQNCPVRSGPHGNMLKKFRNGWIPWQDNLWLTWKRMLHQGDVPTFFISDLHLFHANSIKFDKRPFVSLEDMHEGLIRRWNSVVPSHGLTYILGDLGRKKLEIINILKRMKGSKILISGNHDASPSYMYKMGISCVLNSATLYIQNERVELNHCPPRGAWREDTTGMRNSPEGENWHGELRHDKFTRDYNEEVFWLHGHCHKQPDERTLNNMFDVGGPANNYTPVSQKTIETWIQKTRKLGYGKTQES